MDDYKTKMIINTANILYSGHFQKVGCAAGATHTQFFENAAYNFSLYAMEQNHEYSN